MSEKTITIKRIITLELEVSGAEVDSGTFSELCDDGLLRAIETSVLFDSDEHDLQAFIRSISIDANKMVDEG